MGQRLSERSGQPGVIGKRPMLALAERYKYDAKVSMREDLETGTPLGLDWLSGCVSREAA